MDSFRPFTLWHQNHQENGLWARFEPGPYGVIVKFQNPRSKEVDVITTVLDEEEALCQIVIMLGAGFSESFQHDTMGDMLNPDVEKIDEILSSRPKYLN